MTKKRNNGSICIRIGDRNKAFIGALSGFFRTISCNTKYMINGERIPINPTFTYIFNSGISLNSVDNCVQSIHKRSQWEFGTNIIKLFNELDLNLSSNDIRKIHTIEIKTLYLNELKR